MKPLDITNQRFGRLTAVRRIGLKKRNSLWLFNCDCGQSYEATAIKVRRGEIVSCGCYRRDESARRLSRHGLHGSVEYRIWRGLKQRCMNASNNGYFRYGGRGISVCNRWIHGDGARSAFECFIDDMGKRPSSRHSIERKDNDGPYDKENCVWATATEQANNRRSNRFITHDGCTRTLKEWAVYCGVSPAAISDRLRKGWNIDKALEIPFSRPKARRRKSLEFRFTDYNATLQHFANHHHLRLVLQRLADDEARSKTRKEIPGVEFKEERHAA